MTTKSSPLSSVGLLFSMLCLSAVWSGCGDSSSRKHDAAALDGGGAALDTVSAETSVKPADAAVAVEAAPNETSAPPADAAIKQDSAAAPDEAVAPDAAPDEAVAPDAAPDEAVVPDAAPDETMTTPVDASVDATEELDVGSTSGNVGMDGAVAMTKNLGRMALAQAVEDQPTAGTIITAGFANFELGATPDSCSPSQTSGDCKFYECPTTSPTHHYLSAGSVSVTGLSSTLSIPYLSSTDGYQVWGTGSFFWNSSLPVTLSATGSADVPPFSIDLVTPHPIILTTPQKMWDGYGFSRSADLVVQWTGGVEGSVVVDLSHEDSVAKKTLEAYCSVSASKGTATVPATILAKLPASVSFSITVINTATKDVGDWSMSFAAAMPALDTTATLSN